MLGAWYLNGTRPVVYGDLTAETATGPSSTSGDAEQGR
jgi:hypothetical protein